jgi:hypothetical protein
MARNQVRPLAPVLFESCAHILFSDGRNTLREHILPARRRSYAQDYVLGAVFQAAPLFDMASGFRRTHFDILWVYPLGKAWGWSPIGQRVTGRPGLPLIGRHSSTLIDPFSPLHHQ